jgi:hypothetical protein
MIYPRMLAAGVTSVVHIVQQWAISSVPKVSAVGD